MLGRLRHVWPRPSASLTLVQTSSRSVATRVGRGLDETELSAARRWLAQLDAGTIPRSIGDISFSRSSGPGGQNVNKVSSKVTLRIPTRNLLPLLPTPIHPAVLGSRYHASKSHDLVIQADDSRKQADNVEACFRKLHDLIVQAGRETVPAETSPEQMRRVAELRKAEAAGRRRIKEFQSKKKSARRSGGREND